MVDMHLVSYWPAWIQQHFFYAVKANSVYVFWLLQKKKEVLWLPICGNSFSDESNVSLRGKKKMAFTSLRDPNVFKIFFINQDRDEKNNIKEKPDTLTSS